MVTFDYSWWNPSVIWGYVYLYRVSSKSPEEQTFQTVGGGILLFFFKQKENMGS